MNSLFMYILRYIVINLEVRGCITIATTRGNQVTLLWCCAYAAAAAAVRGTAALRLALIVLKDE